MGGRAHRVGSAVSTIDVIVSTRHNGFVCVCVCVSCWSCHHFPPWRAPARPQQAGASGYRSSNFQVYPVLSCLLLLLTHPSHIIRHLAWLPRGRSHSTGAGLARVGGLGPGVAAVKSSYVHHCVFLSGGGRNVGRWIGVGIGD